MAHGRHLMARAAAILATALVLTLANTGSVAASEVAATAKQKRTAWLWETSIWRTLPADLLDRAQALKIRSLFIALEIRDGQVRDGSQLKAFLRAAHERGISVLAVEGDPHMVLAKGQPNAIARAQAIRAYQLGALPEEQLDGLQYDIEPYVLPRFDTSNPRHLRKWSSTYRELRRAFTRKLDIVLPFWVSDKPPGADFVRASAASAKGLTVMAYRTKPDRIIAAAAPLLDLGVELDRPVRVALEMGPTDEGPGVSFEGDLDALLRAMRKTLPTFAAWPNFAGFAIHGIVWPGQTAGVVDKRR